MLVYGQRKVENGSSLLMAPDAEKLGQYFGPETDLLFKV
jgi:hypothetical protein